jgi:hypothetical protein
MQDIPVLKLGFKEDWKVLTAALGTPPAFETIDFESAQELLTCATEYPGAMVLAALVDKDDLLKIATLVKLHKQPKMPAMKIVVLNFSGNKNFEKAIYKLGVKDVLEVNVNFKALRFKLDFWLKAVKLQLKNAESAQASQVVPKGSAAANQKDPKTEEKAYLPLPALELEDDIWLFGKETDCRRMMARWMVKLLGPSPYAGSWVEVESKPGVWKFELKKEVAPLFSSGNGSWFFRGDQKPEFNWQENLWLFAGDHFELFFYHEKPQIRVLCKDRKLHLAENSDFARTREKTIRETFDKNFVFQNKAEHLEGEAVDVDPSAHEGGHLQGKVKSTDHVGGAELSGKVKAGAAAEQTTAKAKAPKSPEDFLDTEVLSKKQKPTPEAEKYADWTGKSKADQQKDKNLSGDLKPEEGHPEQEKSRRQGSAGREADHWGGKTKTDEYGKNPLSGKLKTEEPETKGPLDHLQGKAKTEAVEHKDLALKNADSSHQAHYHGKLKERESAAENLNGKAKTEQLEQKPLQGKSESAAPDLGGDPLALNLKPQAGKDPWGGKSTTDQLDHSGLKGPAAGKAKEGALLDLENKKHTHETHYKGHFEAEQFEAKEGRKNQYGEEGAQRPLAGKTATDFVAKHYGSREEAERAEREQKEKSASGLAGKTSTEQLAGHYGSPREKTRSSADVLPFKPKDTLFPVAKTALDEAPDADLERASADAQLISHLWQDHASVPCKLDDFFEQTVIFRCDRPDPFIPGAVKMHLAFAYLGKTTELELQGNLTAVDDADEFAFITIEVPPAEAEKFAGFMRLFEERQANIDVFLKRAKGF